MEIPGIYWPMHYLLGNDEKMYEKFLKNPQFEVWNDMSLKHMAMASSGYNCKKIQSIARKLIRQFYNWLDKNENGWFCLEDWCLADFEKAWKNNPVSKGNEQQVKIFMGPVNEGLRKHFRRMFNATGTLEDMLDDIEMRSKK